MSSDSCICQWNKGIKDNIIEYLHSHLICFNHKLSVWTAGYNLSYCTPSCKWPAAYHAKYPSDDWHLAYMFSRGYFSVEVCLVRISSVCKLWTSSEWSLTWNGEGTETHSWCCTVPLFVQSLTMVALCMAQHQTPTYDNWTAFITQDWDWHWEHSAPAQCPACSQRPTKLLWRNVG